MGRPTIYSIKLVNEICERIAHGESLKSLCALPEFPAMSTVFEWLANPDYADFAEKYTRAREAFADGLVDDLLPIADDGSNDWMEKNFAGQTSWVENGEATRRSVLRVDARKWIASKLQPKKYGDKLDLNHSGNVNHGLTAELIAAIESIGLADTSRVTGADKVAEDGEAKAINSAG